MARKYSEHGQDLSHLLETMRKPTIAAVNGYALGGGCEMALACDLRFASTTARFGQPEINLGIIPGWGGTQRLARTSTLGFAKELVLTGRMVEADEALERGLVNAVFEPGELLPRTLEIAQEIAAKSPIALAYAKEATNRSLARRPRRQSRARGRPVRDPLLDRRRARGPHGLHREARRALRRQLTSPQGSMRTRFATSAPPFARSPRRSRAVR